MSQVCPEYKEGYCPFCGSQEGMKYFYDCGAYLGYDRNNPSKRKWGWYKLECKDRQITQLKKMLGKVELVIEAVSNEKCCVMQCSTDDMAWELISLTKDQAAALLPELRRMLGKP